MKRILIIGAGPAGCYLAQNLRNFGLTPLLLEEDAEVGIPVRCAGVLGADVFENLKLKISPESVQNVIDGAVVHYRDKSFNLFKDKVAYVVNRESFDKSLSAGLEIKSKTKFLDLISTNGGYLVKTNQGDFLADMVIGADGPNSLVRKYLGPSKVNFITGYQITLKGQLPFPANLIQAFFINLFYEFIWVVPETPDTWRIGAICPKPKKAIEDFLKEKNLKGEVVKETGGVIPIGFFKTAAKNIALIGDAAAQVKPLSGGGVYFGLKCGEVLAACIKEGALAKYDRRWKKLLGREIKLGLKSKAVFERLSAQNLEVLFDILKKEAAKIEARGHFELHSTAFLSILKNPKLYRLLWPILKAFFKSSPGSNR